MDTSLLDHAIKEIEEYNHIHVHSHEESSHSHITNEINGSCVCGSKEFKIKEFTLQKYSTNNKGELKSTYNNYIGYAMCTKCGACYHLHRKDNEISVGYPVTSTPVDEIKSIPFAF